MTKLNSIGIAKEPKNRFLNKDYCKQLLKKTNHTNVSVALEAIAKFLEFKPDNLEANHNTTTQ